MVVNRHRFAYLRNVFCCPIVDLAQQSGQAQSAKLIMLILLCFQSKPAYAYQSSKKDLQESNRADEPMRRHESSQNARIPVAGEHIYFCWSQVGAKSLGAKIHFSKYSVLRD